MMLDGISCLDGIRSGEVCYRNAIAAASMFPRMASFFAVVVLFFARNMSPLVSVVCYRHDTGFEDGPIRVRWELDGPDAGPWNASLILALASHALTSFL